MKFVLEGLEEFIAQLHTATAFVISEHANVVKRAGDQAIAHAKAFHDYKDRTGQLTETCRLILKTGGASTDGTLYWPKNYASFVARGTKPHTISVEEPGRRSTGAQYLTFEWNGRFVRKKEVHHPGGKDHSFASDAKFVAIVALKDGLERMALDVAQILR